MVVNRKLRIVSEDEVEFQRFRRDTVGVFELKESITKLEKQAAAQAADTTTRLVMHISGHFFPRNLLHVRNHATTPQMRCLVHQARNRPLLHNWPIHFPIPSKPAARAKQRS